MRRQVPRDVWTGFVLASLGIIIVYQSSRIFRPPALTDALGPRTFPLALGAALVVLGTLLAVRGRRRERSGPLDFGDWAVAARLGVGLAAYIVLLPRLGFLLTNVLVLWYMFYTLGERRHVRSAATAALFTAALFALFVYGLRIPLPGGLGS